MQEKLTVAQLISIINIVAPEVIDHYKFAAAGGYSSRDEADEAFMKSLPIDPTRGEILAQALRGCASVLWEGTPAAAKEIAEAYGMKERALLELWDLRAEQGELTRHCADDHSSEHAAAHERLNARMDMLLLAPQFISVPA